MTPKGIYLNHTYSLTSGKHHGFSGRCERAFTNRLTGYFSLLLKVHSMLLRSSFLLTLTIFSLTLAGCAAQKTAEPLQSLTMKAPIRAASAEMTVALLSIVGQDHEETLIEDAGWHEYVLEIENLSEQSVTIQNVKLLNQNGRYLDSAATYEQITAPPDVGVELAGDVAQTTAGIAAGQFIPYGGTIFGLLSSAVSVSSLETRMNAKRNFMLRVLKNVELAPMGKIQGSAFLPNIIMPQMLVVDAAQDGRIYRVEIPLPTLLP